MAEAQFIGGGSGPIHGSEDGRERYANISKFTVLPTSASLPEIAARNI